MNAILQEQLKLSMVFNGSQSFSITTLSNGRLWRGSSKHRYICYTRGTLIFHAFIHIGLIFQLNEVYLHAPYLSRWYKKVRIDSFSKGSVLVDYFVELANITREVNTQEIKQLFHDALTVGPLPVAPLPSKPNKDNSGEDGDSTTRASERQGRDEKLVKETFILGRFAVDPESTDFIGMYWNRYLCFEFLFV